MKFKATVNLEGKTATGIEVPADIVEKLDKGKRPPVVVTIGKHTYRTTIAPMRGKFLLSLSAENRTAAGVAAGDTVTVTLEVDDAPREVIVPDDFEKALKKEKGARELFDKLSYTNRKEWVRWIEDAKREETRLARLAKAPSMITGGSLHP